MISVLYVDDEAGLLEIAKLFLEKDRGFSVSTATSAEEALTAFPIPSFDAIISDFQMPGMDGIAFLKAVREKFGDIPFILFTGRGREEVVINAINNGADFYLQKGGDPQAQFAELSHKIRQAVRRKQAERSLYDSERRLADIIDFLPDATFAIDRSGKVIAWNQAIGEMTGVAAAEMLGKGEYEYALPFYWSRRPILIDLIDAPDEKITPFYTNIYRTGTSITAETDLPHPKGHRITVLAKVCHLYNQAGEITGTIESIRDITELKRAGQELRRSDERFRNLIQNSTDMIRIIGRDGTIRYSSPSTLRITGYTPSDLTGKDAFGFVHPEDRERVKQAFRDVVSQMNTGSPTEYRLLHADGHYIEVEALASNLLEVPGIEGIVATTRPVAERKKAEAELRAAYEQIAASEEELREQFEELAESERLVRANEERLVMAQEIGKTGSWEFNVLTNTLWGTAESHRIFGLTPRAGNEPIDAIESCITERERVHTALTDLITKGEEYNIEYTINPADGSPPRKIHSVARLEKDAKGRPLRVVGVLHDITERKKAERLLEESGSFLDSVIEQSPHPMWISDSSGTLIRLNQACRDLLRITDSDVVKKYNIFEDNIVEEQGFMPLVAKVFSEGVPVNFPLVYDSAKLAGLPLPHTVKRTLSVTIFPIKDAAGSVTNAVIQHTDITEWKQAEEALRGSEERYRLILMNANDGIIVNELTDRGPGKFIETNDVACRILGMTRDELQDVSLVDLDTPEMKKRAYSIITEIKEKRHAVFQTNYRTKDGREKYLDISVSLFDLNGRATMLSVVRDVTGQKRAEEALRGSEEKFRSIVETSPNIVWEIDLEGKIRYISPMITPVLGYPVEEVLGRSISDLTGEEGKNVPLQELARDTARTGMPPSIEVTARHRDGHEVIFEIRPTRLFDAAGNLGGFQGIAVDITERKKAEVALSRANRQLSLLGGITRHDIVNKVSVIRGFLRVAEKKFPDPGLAELFKKIESNTEMIREQIDFTRAYRDLGTHEPQWIDLDEAIPRSSVPKAITLHADVLGISVFADPMLAKVFFNLLDNSIRHGGRVTEIRVAARAEGGNLVIAWEDNGVGIPADEKERIFDRGFGKNTGLGMFLVREILALTDIVIWENGEPGTGARFEITVPEGKWRKAGGT